MAGIARFGALRKSRSKYPPSSLVSTCNHSLPVGRRHASLILAITVILAILAIPLSSLAPFSSVPMAPLQTRAGAGHRLPSLFPLDPAVMQRFENWPRHGL